MAKGDVVMKFTAEQAAFVQAIEVARAKLEAAAGGARNFGDSLEKAGNKGKWSLDNLKEGAVGLAVGMVGVNSAASLLEKGVEKVGATFEVYFERMKKKAEELLGKIVSVNTAMGDTGRADKGPEARKAIEEIVQMRPGGRALGSKEVTDTYVAITRAVGNAIDAKESTRVAEKGRAAGMSEEGAHQLGIIHAQLGREGITGDKAENMAFTAATNKMGDLNFRTFFRAGGDERALQMMVAASRVNEGQRKIDSILNLTEDAEPSQLKEWKRHRGQHADELALQGMPKDQRLAAILANPNLAPAGDRSAVASIADAMKKVQSGNLDAAIAAKKATADNAAKLATDSHIADVAVEHVSEIGADKALAIENKNKVIRALFEKEFPHLSAVPGVSSGMANAVNWWQGSNYTGGASSSQDAHTQALQENTEATRRNTQSNNGGPALKNDSEGQK